jgi:hypothetical protein
MYPIATGMTFSTAAYSDSADQVVPTYQNVGPGILRLVAKSSAIGMKAVLKINGVPIVDNLAMPYIGATGGLDFISNVVCEQRVKGGRVELVWRNTTAGALTTDFVLQFEPTGK